MYDVSARTKVSVRASVTDLARIRHVTSYIWPRALSLVSAPLRSSDATEPGTVNPVVTVAVTSLEAQLLVPSAQKLSVVYEARVDAVRADPEAVRSKTDVHDEERRSIAPGRAQSRCRVRNSSARWLLSLLLVRLQVTL